MKTSNYRLTGLLYLLVIVLAGSSQGYIRGMLINYDDPSLTAAKILENIAMFRAGLTLDLLAFILDAVISVLLYQMFKSYGKNMAMIAAVLRLIAHPAIGSLNLLNHYLAYQVLGGADFLTTFSPAQLESLSMLFIDAHRYGYLIAGGFFGVHCLLLGILIFRSNTIPNFIGGFLIGSATGYLIETFGNFNLPGYEHYTALIVGISAAIGEVTFTLYLIVKGKKSVE